MKFGICNEGFKGWSFEKTVSYVASIGYEGIEIAPFTLADSVRDISSQERAKLKDSADRHDLEIIGLHWLLASPEGLSLSSPDKAIREKTTEYLKELINLCGDLDGKVMVLGSPGQRRVFPGCTYEVTWDWVKEAFAEVLPLAKQRNVTIALEPLSRKETDFVNTCAEGIKMIEEIDHPNFKIHLDVNAMSDEDKPIAQIITSAKDYLFHFHANDPNHLGPGFGEVKYEPIREALEGIGYTKYISVEAFDFTPGVEVIAEKSIEYLKRIFKD